MQIRIVDQHGLSPGPGQLALRSVFQFLAIWIVGFQELFEAIDYRPKALAIVVIVAVSLFYVITAAMVTFGRKGRTLYDLLLGTRVCLDAGSTEVSD